MLASVRASDDSAVGVEVLDNIHQAALDRDDCSIILKIEAPRLAALVRNPERMEYPANSAGSSPTRSA
jgi:hypothetical protein